MTYSKHLKWSHMWLLEFPRFNDSVTHGGMISTGFFKQHEAWNVFQTKAAAVLMIQRKGCITLNKESNIQGEKRASFCSGLLSRIIIWCRRPLWSMDTQQERIKNKERGDEFQFTRADRNVIAEWLLWILTKSEMPFRIPLHQSCIKNNMHIKKKEQTLIHIP